MKKQYRQASAYLDDATYSAILAIAKQHRRSLSSHLKSLIEREVNGAPAWQKEIRDNSIKVLVAVDALVKHHPNDKLFGVVKATRNARIEGASDEA